MCLEIKTPAEATKAPKTEKIVYKVYQDARPQDGPDFMASCYFEDVIFRREIGTIVQSDRPHQALSDIEVLSKKINKGIHCFTKEEDAQAVARKYASVFSRHFVVSVKVKPEDFVARGFFEVGYIHGKETVRLDSEVYMKVEVVEIFD